MTKPRILLRPDECDRPALTLTGDRAHYLARVRRVRPGDLVLAAAPDGTELLLRVTAAAPGQVSLSVLTRRPADAEPAHEVTVALAVLKSRAMDWAIQKLTEVGATRIIPVLCTRAVSRLPTNRWPHKQRRWGSIAAEATRQCGRSRPPHVHAPVQVPALAELCAERAFTWLLLDPAADSSPLASALCNADAAGVIVGPEGDFTSEEKAALIQAGAVPVSLGPRILRAETAAVIACALVLHYLGDLGAAPRP